MIRGELLLLTTAIIAWWTFKGEGRRTVFFISLLPLSKRHPAAVVTPPSFSFSSTIVHNGNGRCCCRRWSCRWCWCCGTVANDPIARRRHTLTTLAIMRTHKRTSNCRGRADNNEENKNNCLPTVVILFEQQLRAAYGVLILIVIRHDIYCYGRYMGTTLALRTTTRFRIEFVLLLLLFGHHLSGYLYAGADSDGYCND